MFIILVKFFLTFCESNCINSKSLRILPLSSVRGKDVFTVLYFISIYLIIWDIYDWIFKFKLYNLILFYDCCIIRLLLVIILYYINIIIILYIFRLLYKMYYYHLWNNWKFNYCLCNFVNNKIIILNVFILFV